MHSNHISNLLKNPLAGILLKHKNNYYYIIIKLLNFKINQLLDGWKKIEKYIKPKI